MTADAHRRWRCWQHPPGGDIGAQMDDRRLPYPGYAKTRHGEKWEITSLRAQVIAQRQVLSGSSGEAGLPTREPVMVSRRSARPYAPPGVGRIPNCCIRLSVSR
jgi:hypothetical protein